MKAKVKGINLLPKEYIQAEKVRMIQMLVGGVLILEVFAFIGGAVIPPKLEAKSVEARLDDIALKLNDERYADVNKTIQALETAKAEVAEWVAKYGNLKQENFVSARILDSLTARIPMGMAIENIAITLGEGANTEKNIAIQGTADKLETVFSYATLLEGVYGVGTVYYEGSIDKELGTCRYTLNVKIPAKVEVVPPAETTDTGSAAEGGSN